MLEQSPGPHISAGQDTDWYSDDVNHGRTSKTPSSAMTNILSTNGLMTLPKGRDASPEELLRPTEAQVVVVRGG